ncbi:hypothetical protein [Mycobacterium sp. MUNTM1]
MPFRDLIAEVHADRDAAQYRCGKRDFHLPGGHTERRQDAGTHGAHPTYLVSNAKAKVVSCIRRPPETHPGRIDRPVKVPINLTRVHGEVFTRWVQPG